MSRSYFSRASAVVLVYDVTNQCSFGRLQNWLENASRYEDNFKTFLVGNKIDFNSANHEVDTAKVLDFAKRNSISEDFIFRISAKSGEGFSKLFEKIAKVLTEECMPTDFGRRPLQISDRLGDIHTNRMWSKCKC